jgi:hypothetical protein
MGYPGIQYTNSSPQEPSPQMHPLKGAKGEGPLVAIGPSNGMRQRMQVEDHVKMQRPRTRGVPSAGEMKR